jgi:hypothetical protein
VLGVDVAQVIMRKRFSVLSRLDQTGQDRIGVGFKDASHGADTDALG